MIPYVFPKYDEERFNCPHCKTLAHQHWSQIYKTQKIQQTAITSDIYMQAVCTYCKNISIWYNQKMIYPSESSAPLPNPDMSNEVKEIFEESRQILSSSPRASAALLRLCVDKITEELGEKDRDLNARIGNLVKKGLSTQIQQALDVVRVTGNDALHIGQINVNDSPETAHSLFDIVNIIIQKMISEPKKINEMYKALPKEKQDSITNRDKTT